MFQDKSRKVNYATGAAIQSKGKYFTLALPHTLNFATPTIGHTSHHDDPVAAASISSVHAISHKILWQQGRGWRWTVTETIVHMMLCHNNIRERDIKKYNAFPPEVNVSGP